MVPNPRVPERATVVSTAAGRKSENTRMSPTASPRLAPWMNARASCGAQTTPAAANAAPLTATGHRAIPSSGRMSRTRPVAR